MAMRRSSSQKIAPKYIYLNHVTSSVSIVSRQNSMLEPITESEILTEKSIITDVVMEEEEDEGEGGDLINASSVESENTAAAVQENDVVVIDVPTVASA